jgi:hypothetical protein
MSEELGHDLVPDMPLQVKHGCTVRGAVVDGQSNLRRLSYGRLPERPLRGPRWVTVYGPANTVRTWSRVHKAPPKSR